MLGGIVWSLVTDVSEQIVPSSRIKQFKSEVSRALSELFELCAMKVGRICTDVAVLHIYIYVRD
jgi:hypothetical protein